MHCFIQVDIFKYENVIGARHVNSSHWALLVIYIKVIMHEQLCVISYSYITSTSRISLLLQETEGERSPRSSVNNNDILRVLVI